MRYRTIVVDLPWPYDDGWQGKNGSRRPLPYESMPLLPALVGVERPEVPPPSPRESESYFRHGTTWWNWPVGDHSAKPEAFLDIVEQVSPEPRVELFARRARFGWDYWGNESLGTANLSA